MVSVASAAVLMDRDAHALLRRSEAACRNRKAPVAVADGCADTAETADRRKEKAAAVRADDSKANDAAAAIFFFALRLLGFSWLPMSYTDCVRILREEATPSLSHGIRWMMCDVRAFH